MSLRGLHHWMIERVRPVNQIVGRGHAHLRLFDLRIAQVIHPIFAINFLRYNGARLRPLYIPFAFETGNDHSAALPMD